MNRINLTNLYSVTLAGCLILLAEMAATATEPLATISEQSGFQKTGRYDEVIALCGAFEKAYPKVVRSIE